VTTGLRERRRLNLPDGSILYVNELTEVKVAADRRIEVACGEVFVEVVPQLDGDNQRALFEVVTPTRTVTALGTKFLLCDGTGRHVYFCVMSEGLREQVVCDGSQLIHIYADIGLASERVFSRFHRSALETFVPWLMPTAENLLVKQMLY